MLDTVVASRFIKRMEHGRNSPLLLEVERASGDFVEVVTKFDGAECGPGGLAREAFVAMLATDLGLPVPECFVVDIPSNFLETVPEHEAIARSLIAQSGQQAFGSAHHPGWHLYPAGHPLPASLVEQATEVLAFDGICLNPDRRPEKQNCLFSGSELMIIDHELALIHASVGSFLCPYPWAVGGMGQFAPGPGEHLFYRGTSGKSVTANRLEAAFGSHGHARMSEYQLAIPAAWDQAGKLCSGMCDYLKLACSNTAGSFIEVRRLLA